MLRLPFASPKERGSKDFEPVVDSHRYDILQLDFPQDNLYWQPNDFNPRSPSHDNHPNLEKDSSTLWTKWWEKLIDDVHDNELVEGRSSGGEGKKNATNFAPMANIQNISLLKNNT